MSQSLWISLAPLAALFLVACSGTTEDPESDAAGDGGNDLSSFDTNGDADRRWDAIDDADSATDSGEDGGSDTAEDRGADSESDPDARPDADATSDTAPDSSADADPSDTGLDAELDTDPDAGACSVGADCEDDDPCTVFSCVDRVCVSAIRDYDGDGSPDGECGGTDCNDRSEDISAGSERPCSNSCGVEGVERCVDAEWTDCSAPVDCDCSPGEAREEDCAMCGTAIRLCDEDGSWGDLGPCLGGGVCEPDDVGFEDCEGLECGEDTLYGVLPLTCTSSCEWSSGECRDAPACCPGDTDDTACGSCGTSTRVCGADGRWDPFGACVEPECCAGDSDVGSCGDCGIRARSCESEAWGEWGGCVEPECCPGDTSSTGCGDCGTQALGCSDGSWAPIDICVEPECCAGDTDLGECGDCGTQSRSCDGGTWGSWGLCAEPECCDGDIEADVCNMCGRQTRTCGGSSWGEWGECIGSEGPARGCDPGFHCNVDGWCYCADPPCELP